MSRSMAVVFRLLVLVAAIVLGIPGSMQAEENPFGPIRLGANRSSYRGPCPVSIVYTGNINFVAHPRGFTFNYYWVRSDGAKSPVTVVHPSLKQRMVVVRETWRLGAPGRHYDASVTLFVNSGNTHLEQASNAVSVSCR